MLGVNICIPAKMRKNLTHESLVTALKGALDSLERVNIHEKIPKKKNMYICVLVGTKEEVGGLTVTKEVRKVKSCRLTKQQ